MTTRLTVIILTFNEERHIARAINSVRTIADKVIVVDSFSSDQTVSIAKALGAQVHQRAFVTQSDQFNWALDNLPITSDWIMRLDADEIIEGDLAATIYNQLSQLSPDIVGIMLHRKHIFMNRWIRHGGRYPLTLLRIWRIGTGRAEDRWMDEHIITSGGRNIVLQGGFADHNLQDLTYFTAKHNAYATREALDVILTRYGLRAKDQTVNEINAPTQTGAKRWLKERLFNKMPFWIGAASYFLFRYMIQLGFLDGRPGLVYHFLQGFWYRFLAGAKVTELEIAIDGACDDNERLERLSVATGYKLSN
jgi:glycosyltransferase involved in cell wall biosynthesis